MKLGQRVRLCLRDLYHQDVVEMIERETRRYEIHSIEHPDHPDFGRAYRVLWDAFGPSGEMEPEPAIRDFVLADPFVPLPSGSYLRYFLIVARDREGHVRGVRDGSVLVNPRYSPGLCLVYLAHIYVMPEARGTVLTYWLRTSPVELAMQFLSDLHRLGKLQLPAPDAPGRYYGMQLNLAAEMEYWSPEDTQSLQRILFYGRGGFDVVDPKHFPYAQPDFRDPEVIRATGNTPLPFMLLLRRMGRERQARLPIEEARASMRLLYDEFERFCDPEDLQASLDVVLDRLDRREAKGKTTVDLLPLPTGARDLARLKRIFRWNVFSRYYPDHPGTRAYREGPVRARLAENPRWPEQEIARLATELGRREHYVYGSRDRDLAWEGSPMPREPSPAAPSEDEPGLTPEPYRPSRPGVAVAPDPVGLVATAAPVPTRPD